MDGMHSPGAASYTRVLLAWGCVIMTLSCKTGASRSDSFSDNASLSRADSCQAEVVRDVDLNEYEEMVVDMDIPWSGTSLNVDEPAGPGLTQGPEFGLERVEKCVNCTYTACFWDKRYGRTAEEKCREICVKEQSPRTKYCEVFERPPVGEPKPIRPTKCRQVRVLSVGHGEGRTAISEHAPKTCSAAQVLVDQKVEYIEYGCWGAMPGNIETVQAELQKRLAPGQTIICNQTLVGGTGTHQSKVAFTCTTQGQVAVSYGSCSELGKCYGPIDSARCEMKDGGKTKVVTKRCCVDPSVPRPDPDSTASSQALGHKYMDSCPLLDCKEVEGRACTIYSGAADCKSESGSTVSYRCCSFTEESDDPRHIYGSYCPK